MLATKIEKTCPKKSMTATALTDRQIYYIITAKAIIQYFATASSWNFQSNVFKR